MRVAQKGSRECHAPHRRMRPIGLWAMPRAWARLVAVGTIRATLLVLFLARAAAADEKTVLMVYAETRLLPVVSILDHAIRSTLQTRSPSPIRFHTEYMDLSWVGSPGAEEMLSRLLKEKYGTAKIDVIIPCGESAIRFVVGQRAKVFAGIPVAFCTADRDAIGDLPLPPDVTGVTMSIDFAGAAELALRLHPGTRRIVFI